MWTHVSLCYYYLLRDLFLCFRHQLCDNAKCFIDLLRTPDSCDRFSVNPTLTSDISMTRLSHESKHMSIGVLSMYNINLLFIWCDWHWHSKWQYIYDVFTVHNIRISYITRELYNNNNYDFALSTGAVWIAGWRALRNLFIQYFITISCGRVRAQFSLALVWACACASFDCSNRQRTYKWERLYWSNKNWIIVMVWPKCGLSGEFRLDSRAHYD